jgi:hypothetical protein
LNIFVLDENPKKSAKYHCDKHVNKMLLEATQILNTALYKSDLGTLAFYEKCFENHPCCEWAAESRWNFMYLLQHTHALGEEYISRFSKDEKHLSHRKLTRAFDGMTKEMIRREMPSEPFSEPPLAMPDEYKSEDTVKSYREYYREEKVPQDWCEWSNEKPDWI